MGPSLDDLLDDEHQMGTFTYKEEEEEEQSGKDGMDIYLSTVRPPDDFSGFGFYKESIVPLSGSSKGNEAMALRMDGKAIGNKLSLKFGQGVFEDTDDIDVYDDDSGSNNYDKELIWNKNKNKPEVALTEGKISFTAGGNLITEELNFLPLKVPEDFTGTHKFKELLYSNNAIGISSLNPTSRGELLGAKQLPVNIPTKTPPHFTGGSKSYLPFSEDPVKQHRYIAFLQNNYHAISSELDEEHRKKEIVEFEKLQNKFQEIPDLLKGRFTKAAFSDSQLTLPSQDIYKEEEEVKAKANAIIPDPIRFTNDWPPNKLLCKRFGVKDPYLDAQPIFTLQPKQSNNLDAQAFLMSLPAFCRATPTPPEGVPEVKEELPEPEKPAMSIFKAIFENSDSEEDE